MGSKMRFIFMWCEKIIITNENGIMTQEIMMVPWRKRNKSRNEERNIVIAMKRFKVSHDDDDERE
jgi:hypothetical protein